MCLSKVYVARNGEPELVMTEVASMRIENDRLLLSDLLGEQKEIVARIREIDFLTHRITLENVERGFINDEV
jgi:predicted RNA-binding protein